MTGLFGGFSLDAARPASDRPLADVLRARRHGSFAELRAHGCALFALGGPAGQARVEEDESGQLAVAWLSAREGPSAAAVFSAYRAHGPAAVRQLRGAFVLALFDRVRRGILLCRDRAGCWPLFVRAGARDVAFSTSLAPLVRARLAPRVLDPKGATAFFLYGSLPSPWTLVRGVEAAPAGAAWWADKGGLRRQAFPVDFEQERASGAVEDVIAETASAVREAIQVRRDTPAVASVLPTGPEQLMLAMHADVVNVGPPLPAGQTAARACHMANARYVELPVSPTPDDLLRIVEWMECPSADPAWLRVDASLSWTRDEGRAWVDGVGGEVAFGADPRYPDVLTTQAISRALPSRLVRVGQRLGRLREVRADLLGPDARALLDPDFRRTLPSDGDTEGTLGALQQVHFAASICSLELPARFSLCAAHGVEAHAPFADARLLDRVAGWPVRARADGRDVGTGLRRLSRLLAPQLVFEPRPQPTLLEPVGDWYRGPLRETAEAVLFGAPGGGSGILDSSRARRIWYAHQLGVRDHGPIIHAAVLFELWWAHLFGSSR